MPKNPNSIAKEIAREARRKYPAEAKPKVPKTEKMWMAWNEVEGFRPEIYKLRKKDIQGTTMFGGYVRVRIVPEAEWQRLRKAAKGEE